MSALDLLSGDAQTFLAKIWASRVHIHHADSADLVGLLSFDDVDHLLTSTAIRTPAVRIAKDGGVLPQSDYTRHATLAGQALTGLLDPAKVFALFDEGATVVLQGLHRYWQPLAALVGELELGLGHPCQANAYLTPPGSQGFAVHSDSHDVFVFQTHGSKVWEVHEHGEQQTVVLEPGVSMYLPTGTPHAARAQDTVSLHVTIGINQVVWRDVLWPSGWSPWPSPCAASTPRPLPTRRYVASSPPARCGSAAASRTGSRRASSPTPPSCGAAPGTRACSGRRATRSGCCSATGSC